MLVPAQVLMPVCPLEVTAVYAKYWIFYFSFDDLSSPESTELKNAPHFIKPKSFKSLQLWSLRTRLGTKRSSLSFETPPDDY